METVFKFVKMVDGVIQHCRILVIVRLDKIRLLLSTFICKYIWTL